MTNESHQEKEALRSRALTLMNSRRLGEAKALFVQLCDLDPQDAEAWYSLSNINGMLNDIDAVGACCRRVLAIRPDHGGANTNLGHVYFHHRRFDEAIAQYDKALEMDPQNTAAFYNLGKACRSPEHLAKFVDRYRQVLANLPAAGTVRKIFWETMGNVSVAAYDPWLDAELQEYFAMTDVDYRPVTSLAARLLKLKYRIPSPLDDDADISGKVIEWIAADKLFLIMLTRAVNTDADLELILTKARRALFLNYCRDRRLGPAEFRAASALARQGISNEYVFAVDAEEARRLGELRREIEHSTPAVHTPDAGLEARLLAFGMYEWLATLSCAEHLSRLPSAAWSETVRPFLAEALINPLAEQEIKKQIVSLGDIADQASQLVRSQYEENPYPRWLAMPEIRKGNLGRVLQRAFPHFAPPPFLDGPIQILVAGCGTGKHPIETALSYGDAEVVAVDISKSSLAYATRMARKYRVGNIKFMQGDILELAKLNRRFHVIESVGVLHHMKDPLAGWKVLAGLLVEGGLMKIGLYSELARKSVVEARAIISREELVPSRENMRNFRARILRRELGDALYAMASSSYPFFSTSGCRDLLFHYQEHRYTLPRLAEELAELNLDFIGFQFDDMNPIHLYRELFPADKDMRDLRSWDSFENKYPGSFGKMYRFWCQNKSTHN